MNDYSSLLVKSARLDLSVEIVSTNYPSCCIDFSDQLKLCRSHTSNEMSYNASDSNQQWQHSVDPNNQQHLQSFNQQSSPNSSTPGGGNYHRSQQSYLWTDSNTQGQHHSSQQSWSWQGQTAVTPAIQSSPAFSPPSVLTQSTTHLQLHQQMHQNAMNHAQQALAHHQQAMNMHRNVAMSMSNITPMMQQTAQPQITYQSMSPRSQSVYQQNVRQQSSQQQQ